MSTDTLTKSRWVYSFGGGSADGDASMKNLLGGKGANLAEMSSLGLPVPPGFTITTEACVHYYSNEKQYPAELKDQVLTGADGQNLLAGYKRAGNILKAEEKKGELPVGPAVGMPAAPKEEGALIAALQAAEPAVAQALQQEDFADAMRALSGLRAPVDAFFEAVLVNSENAAERENRLRLLVQVRDLMERVADFSQVTG